MASVSLDESDESGTPATPAPVKKSKRLSSTPQVGVKMIYFRIFLHDPLDLNEKSKIGVISFQCLIVDTFGIKAYQFYFRGSNKCQFLAILNIIFMLHKRKCSVCIFLTISKSFKKGIKSWKYLLTTELYVFSLRIPSKSDLYTFRPLHFSNHENYNFQEAEVVQGDATTQDVSTQKKTLERTLSESESKEEFHQSRTTDSLGRSALGPPEIQIIEKGIKWYF